MKKDIRYTHKIDMEKLNNLTQEQIDNDECGVLGELVSVDTVDRREYSDKVEIDVGTIYLNRIKNGFEAWNIGKVVETPSNSKHVDIIGIPS